MLARSRRLGRRGLSSVRSSRRSVSDVVAAVRFLPAKAPGRFSVVVSKSVARTAVDRNTLRRRVYEMVRLQSLPFDAVIYLKRKASYQELSSSLSTLLARARRQLR